MTIRPLQWFAQRSIRWQLIAAVALAHTVLMTIFVIGVVLLQREFLFSKGREHVEFQSLLLADSSEHLVLMHDVAAIDELLTNLSLDRHVRYAMVTTPQGVVLAHTTHALEGQALIDARSQSVLHGSSASGSYEEGKSVFASASPIRSQGQIVGWAWVGRDFSDDEANLQQILLAGIFYTVAAAFVGVVAAVMLGNKLLRPLSLLLAGAKRLADDRLEEPIPTMHSNEVGMVIDAFNQAMRRLADQRNALRKEVAERAHAEHELHQIYGLSHRRAAELDAVIESLPEAVSIGTSQGLTKCNARALTLLKVSSLQELSDLTSRHQLLSADDRSPMSAEQTPFRLALAGKIVGADVILQDRQTLEETYIRMAAAPVYQNNAIVGAVSVASDITQERLEQEKLRRAKAEAEEANRAKDHFLAVLSHELRTPLTPVLTLAQMMERDPALPEEARQDIITIRRNVELEAQLIDDLLDLTRISRGKISLTVVPVDVHEKLRSVLHMCESEYRAKSLQITTEFLAEQHWVSGDATRLQQVFWNLIRNAIKFTRPGDRITLRTQNDRRASDEQGELRIDVVDNGIGIEPAALQRVFDAFEQGGEEVTRAFGGLGLGLTISKAMVDLHHGRLTAASDGKDHGATFSVHLPVAPTPAEPSNGRDNPEPKLKSPSQHQRILLVEDHLDTSRATARILSQSGYRVQTAASVAEAIRLARAEPFDLIISDLGLPDGSGHDLIKQLLADAPANGEAVRGIAVSGYGQTADLLRSHEAGFVDHLVKPIHPDQLLHAIDDALHPKSTT